MRTQRVGAGISHEQALDSLLEKHRKLREQSSFRLLDREWTLLPGVYAPNLTACAALYEAWLPAADGMSFCDMGCGTGYLSVLAAEKGAKVTAVDLSEEAAKNTRLNVARYGMGEAVEVLRGDLFYPIPQERTFDVVFWNSNFVNRPSAGGSLDSAFFDPGYEAHSRFFAGVGDRLTDDGRAFLGFSSLGDHEALADVAAAQGWRVVTRRVAVGHYAAGDIRYELLELRPL